MQAILQAAARPDSQYFTVQRRSKIGTKEIGLLLQISNWNLPVPDLSALLSGRWNQLGCGAGKSIVLGQFAAFALQLLSPALERLLKSGEGRSRGFEPFSASHLHRRWKNLNPKLLVYLQQRNDDKITLCEATLKWYCLCLAGEEEGKTKNPTPTNSKET